MYTAYVVLKEDNKNIYFTNLGNDVNNAEKIKNVYSNKLTTLFPKSSGCLCLGFDYESKNKNIRFINNELYDIYKSVDYYVKRYQKFHNTKCVNMYESYVITSMIYNTWNIKHLVDKADIIIADTENVNHSKLALNIMYYKHIINCGKEEYLYNTYDDKNSDYLFSDADLMMLIMDKWRSILFD